ncbi:DUF3667 domain-containing protein [Hymenobacter koreensis]|uniref:DUF3667 domain-containing protein n=1 Tax=Hymenobacter koreensis TaxID=1084523 RepID=UPI0031E57952
MNPAPAPAAESHPTTTEACVNCAQPLATGPFCPYCGQARPHRLSVGHLLHELVHVFTHADKSIFAYARQVLLHPGRVVSDYLAGRRKRYFNPFQFLLLMAGFVTTLNLVLKYYEGTAASIQAQFRGYFSNEQVERVGQYFEHVGKYYNLWWLLLLLPLFALITWLVYYKRLNYAEAFFVQVVTGAAFHLWFLVALFPMLWLTNGKPGTYSSILQSVLLLIYLVLVGRRGLGLTWGGAVWRAAAVVGIGMALSWQLNGLLFRWYVFWR